MNTNEIISYNLSTSPNMEQIKDMLNKAYGLHKVLESIAEQFWEIWSERVKIP